LSLFSWTDNTFVPGFAGNAGVVSFHTREIRRKKKESK